MLNPKINVLIRGFGVYKDSLMNLLNADSEINAKLCFLKGKESSDPYQQANFAGCYWCLSKDDKCLSIITTFIPDVLLLDIEKQDINDNNTIKKIKDLYPSIKILVLANCYETPSIMEMIKSGINGHLFKDSNFEELIVAIKNLNKGKNYFQEQVVNQLVEYAKSGGGGINHKGTADIEVYCTSKIK